MERVRVAHFRMPREFEGGLVARYYRGSGFDGTVQSEPSERGGMTTAEVTLGTTTLVATAHCSIKDSFSYRIGRNIAVGRLRKRIERLGYTINSDGFVETIAQ